MKLYDPGYEIGLERLKAIGKPQTPSRCTTLPAASIATAALYTQVRAPMCPPTSSPPAEPPPVPASRRHSAPTMPAMLGLYLLLLMLGSHDLAVMRGAFGEGRPCRHAQPVGDDQLLAVLDFDGVPCTLEIGVARI